jgi:hypothetical protein
MHQLSIVASPQITMATARPLTLLHTIPDLTSTRLLYPKTPRKLLPPTSKTITSSNSGLTKLVTPSSLSPKDCRSLAGRMGRDRLEAYEELRIESLDKPPFG